MEALARRSIMAALAAPMGREKETGGGLYGESRHRARYGKPCSHAGAKRRALAEVHRKFGLVFTMRLFRAQAVRGRIEGRVQACQGGGSEGQVGPATRGEASYYGEAYAGRRKEACGTCILIRFLGGSEFIVCS